MPAANRLQIYALICIKAASPRALDTLFLCFLCNLGCDVTAALGADDKPRDESISS